MNKNKFGFTLAEVLVSLAVIGVIMALSVNSIKIISLCDSTIVSACDFKVSIT